MVNRYTANNWLKKYRLRPQKRRHFNIRKHMGKIFQNYNVFTLPSMSQSASCLLFLYFNLLE